MTDWSLLTRAERIALVQHHHTRDSSAAAIARSIGLGVTRNAVVGMYHRAPALKLSHPLGGSNNGVKGRPRAERREPMAKIKVIRHKQELLPQAPVYVPPPTRPEFRNLALLDLKPNECKWPEGDRDFTFCGAPAEGSYCRFHARLSYAPPREGISR